MVRQALDDPENPSVEGGRAVFVATLLASYFMRGGYDHAEVLAFIERRIEALSRMALEGTYAIHMNEADLGGLPKQWVGKPIIRPEMDPMSGAKPLPFIHDLFGLAYLPATQFPASTRKKIDVIVSYCTDERYRAFPWGYGYIWSKANPRVCYGCGWSLDLPDADSSHPGDQRKIIQRLELLARLPAARRSNWFGKALAYMETFRTERGTYRVPRSYLVESKSGYYVGGEYMGLEDHRRTATAIELESTFRMLLLRKLVNMPIDCCRG